MTRFPETISACNGDQDEWRVIIETPKGSHQKYKYAEEFASFQLAKVLPEGMVFPFDFGFLPCTRGADGDPLDVLLLMDQPTFCGCLVLSRLVGVIEAEQTERDGTTERNDRLVAVPLETHRFGKIKNIKEVDQQMIDEVERFFQFYNAQAGKRFKLLGLHGPRRAETLATEGMTAFAKHVKGNQGRKRKGK